MLFFSSFSCLYSSTSAPILLLRLPPLKIPHSALPLPLRSSTTTKTTHLSPPVPTSSLTSSIILFLQDPKEKKEMTNTSSLSRFPNPANDNLIQTRRVSTTLWISVSAAIWNNTRRTGMRLSVESSSMYPGNGLLKESREEHRRRVNLKLDVNK